MAESYRDLVNRVLRDHEGYTGDGKGGNGELPAGDRSTSRKPITKRDLREVLVAGEISVDAAVEAADRAETAQGIAEAAAATAAGSALTFADLPSLLSDPRSFSAGTIILTRAEASGYEVVTSDPDLITAGGIGLRAIGRVFRPAMFGLKGDGTDTAAQITRMLTRASAARVPIIWDGGTYAFDRWDDPAAAPFVEWIAEAPTVLRSTSEVPIGGAYGDDHFIRIAGKTVSETTATRAVYGGSARITLDTTAGLAVGELLMIRSTRMIETDHRGQARHGIALPVVRFVSSDQVELERAVPVTMLVGNLTCTVTSVISATELAVSGLSSVERADARYRFLVKTGPAAGATGWITDFNPATNRISCDPGSGSFPGNIGTGAIIEIVREISVIHTRAAHVRIRGPLTLERPATVDATAGDRGFMGLQLLRAVRPVVDGLVTRGFSDTGLRLTFCFEPEIRNTTHIDCNRAYDQWDGTGYGIAVSQTSFGVFENIRGIGCRRTVDFGGTQGASYYNLARNIQGYGGGTSYTGSRFWPTGPQQQTVVGSHGAAVGTRYVDAMGVGTYGVVNCRGDRETVRGIYGSGRIDRMINVFRGDGLDVDGIYYRAPGFGWAIPRAARIEPSSTDHLRVVAIFDAATVLPDRVSSLRGLDIQGCRRAVVEVTGSGTIGPISVDGTVWMDNDANNTPGFDGLLREGTGTPVLTGPVDMRGLQLRNNPAAPKASVRYLDIASFEWSGDARALLPGGQVVLPIEPDSVVKLQVPTNQTAARVSVMGYFRDRNWCLLDGVVWAGRAGNKSPVPAASMVSVSADVLTGTTGTAGEVTVSLNPTGGDAALYVESRLSAMNYFQITCDALV